VYLKQTKTSPLNRSHVRVLDLRAPAPLLLCHIDEARKQVRLVDFIDFQNNRSSAEPPNGGTRRQARVTYYFGFKSIQSYRICFRDEEPVTEK